MTVRAYPNYRMSGIEWIGSIPSDWDVGSLARVVSEVEDPNSDLRQQNRLSLSYGKIIERDIDSNDGLLPENFSTYNIIRPDDIVLRLTDLQNDRRSLRSAISIFHGIITAAYTSIRPNAINAGFLAYLLHSYDVTKVFYSMGGGLRQTLNFDDLKYLPILMPTLREQSAIAAFLDRETGKIDALVAEQERLIALLKEKRQAVISQAVIKGLNPNAPMKNSGVPWLGEVPAHWEVGRIKHCLRSLDQGWSPQCEGSPVDSPEEWGVLKVGCVNGGMFNKEQNKKLPLDLDGINALTVKRGDILISRANTRDLVGSAALVPQDYPKLMLSDKLYRIRLNESMCSTDFLLFYLNSDVARRQIELMAGGASQSMLNISQDVIADLNVPLPPVSEQRSLTTQLSTSLQTVNVLSTQATRAIALLRERRAALISAAVTGKIDVRDTVPATQDAA